MAAALLVLWFVIATAVAAGVLVGTAIAAPRPAAPATAPQAEGPDWSPGPSRPVPDPGRITPSPAVAGSSPQPTSAPRTAKPSAVPMAPAAADVPPTVAGVATWYCSSTSPCTIGFPAGGLYAAAGSELRAALGPDWRGSVVTVARADGAAAVRVTLIDACACAGERVIDLYAAAMARLAPLSRGVVPVEVSW